jgi:hypothetical protein
MAISGGYNFDVLMEGGGVLGTISGLIYVCKAALFVDRNLPTLSLGDHLSLYCRRRVVLGWLLAPFLETIRFVIDCVLCSMSDAATNFDAKFVRS